MSRIVDALEAQGLARRRANPQDGRGVFIAATKKGTALLKQGRARRVKFLASYLTGLNHSELTHIVHAVRAIYKALDRRQLA
jgi:DNA-binding MarR family transcriptional regulator